MSSPAKKCPQYFVGLAASFASMSLGVAVGWSAPAAIFILDDNVYNFSSTLNDFSWICAFLSLGAAFAAIPSCMLASRFGRKPILLAAVPPYICSWALIIFAKSNDMLMIGRFLQGCFGGSFVITVPMYTTEVAQVELRGTLGSFFSMSFVTGILYAYIVGALCSYQVLNFACVSLPVIFFAIFIFMPESPAYYMLKGQQDKAARSLHRLRGVNYDPDPELEQILLSVANTEQQAKLGEALKRKATLKGLFIGISLMFFQQFCGSTAIISYATSIFELAGTGLKASISTVLVGTCFVLSNAVSLVLIDKTGRRKLLIISAIFVILTTALMGLYFYLMKHNEDTAKLLSWLPICSICIFIIFYAFGMGPLPFLMMVELFAQDVKAAGCGITATCGAVFAFLSAVSFPFFVQAIGIAASFWMFTFIAILALIFVVFVVPETKGKTLAEIQSKLNASKKIKDNGTEHTSR